MFKLYKKIFSENTESQKQLETLADLIIKESVYRGISILKVGDKKIMNIKKYTRMFENYSWRKEKPLPRNIEGGKELERFCNSLSKHFEVTFQPANGFFETRSEEKNISIWVDFNYDLGAVISYTPESRSVLFWIKWYEKDFSNNEWNDTDIIKNIAGDSFEKMKYQIKYSYNHFLKVIKNKQINYSDEVKRQASLNKKWEFWLNPAISDNDILEAIRQNFTYTKGINKKFYDFLMLIKRDRGL